MRLPTFLQMDTRISGARTTNYPVDWMMTFLRCVFCCNNAND